MKKIEIKHLDITLYEEVLDNGLKVYIVPKNNINNVYATFTTNYGSNTIEFIPIDGNKMVKVPYGIAHFLEHKCFEQEDGIDPFAFFGDNGSDANANTNQVKTTYLFSGPDYIEENLNYLLDYVQSPYFTDENVQKEKGIITQEKKMYQDSPEDVLIESLTYNTFIDHPMKYPIIGTYESINAITKDDLYTCYNTFYHPSNMFVVITGNINPEEIIKIIKNNQEKKIFKKPTKLKIKEYNEPDKVAKKFEEKKLNVTVNKGGIAYKLKIKDQKQLYKTLLYLSILFDVKYGSSSDLVENLINDKIIKNALSLYFDNSDKHMIIYIFGNSEEPKILLERIKDELRTLTIKEEDFDRKKKNLLSSLIYISDNIFSINHFIIKNLIQYKVFDPDRYDEIKDLTLKEFNNFIENIDFSNYSEFIINPKEK